MQLIDLHNDVITEVPEKQFKNYIRNAQKQGVKSILVSVWTTQMKNPLVEIKRARHLIDKIDNTTTKIKLHLHIEDAWFLTLENIDQLISYAPFSIGLTWNNGNTQAGGCNTNANLTNLGKQIIKKLAKANIIIDLAHLNKQSFYQAVNQIKTQSGKLMCSHTCFNQVCPHPRNLDCKQIQTIIDANGIIGLTLVGAFLSQKETITIHDVYLQIKYFLDNFGENNLAIGTDFFGTQNLPSKLTKYKHFKKFAKYLSNQGLTKQTIHKIFYLNAKNFINNI